MDHVLRRPVPEHRHHATAPRCSRFPQGRNAFYQWIHDSLADGKPYNQMATELITDATDNSYTDGAIQLDASTASSQAVPTRTSWTQMTANVFDTFMGISHVNCLLCHNGRGHLDSLSLWGSQTTRYQAWQLASLPVAHHHGARLSRWTTNKNVYYWAVQDNGKNRLRPEHHHRKPPGARGALGLQVRPALLLCPAAVHIQRRYAQGRRELPGVAGPQHHGRFPVRPRHRQLHVGAVLRTRHCRSARHLRPGAARSQQSAALLRGPCSRPTRRCSTRSPSTSWLPATTSRRSCARS